MSLSYKALHAVGQAAYWWTTRLHVVRGHILAENPNCVLVVSHLSHHDPFMLSVAMRPEIDWMARQEFFQSAAGARFMKSVRAFPVDRRGNALPAIREGIRRLKDGKTVGVFPEGEVMEGPDSVLNGGSLKEGAFLLARRCNRPVLPCVMLGTKGYERDFTKWIRYRQGRLWIAFGDPIEPDLRKGDNRGARRHMADTAATQLRLLHEELIATYPESAEFSP